MEMEGLRQKLKIAFVSWWIDFATPQSLNCMALRTPCPILPPGHSLTGRTGYPKAQKGRSYVPATSRSRQVQHTRFVDHRR